MMTLFSAHLGGTISQGNGGSYGKGFLTGAVTGAIGGGVGAGMAGVLGQAGTLGGSILRGAAGGFISGGISGGIGSMMNGGSFGDGFKNKNFWNGDIRADGYGTFSFNNSKGLLDQNWTKLDNGKWFRGGSGDLVFNGTDLNGDWGAAWGKNLGDTYYKSLVDQSTARLNLYPRVLDPRTGRLIPLPSSRPAIPQNLRVDRIPRQQYIEEYMRRGYARPSGGWDQYDIHHILPVKYGGTNDFWNLVPVLRQTHVQEFNSFWRQFGDL